MSIIGPKFEFSMKSPPTHTCVCGLGIDSRKKYLGKVVSFHTLACQVDLHCQIFSSALFKCHWKWGNCWKHSPRILKKIDSVCVARNQSAELLSVSESWTERGGVDINTFHAFLPNSKTLLQVVPARWPQCEHVEHSGFSSFTLGASVTHTHTHTASTYWKSRCRETTYLDRPLHPRWAENKPQRRIFICNSIFTFDYYEVTNVLSR